MGNTHGQQQQQAVTTLSTAGDTTGQQEAYFHIEGTCVAGSSRKYTDPMSSNSPCLLTTRKSKNLKNLQLNLSGSASPSRAVGTGRELSIPLPRQAPDSDSVSNESFSSVQSLKSPPPNRTPTPTGGQTPSFLSNAKPPTQYFRKMPSFTSPTGPNGLSSSSSNPGSATQRKRSATSLSIHIPTGGVGGDDPLESGAVSSIDRKTVYGDYLPTNPKILDPSPRSNANTQSNVHSKVDLAAGTNTSVNDGNLTGSNRLVHLLPFEKPQRPLHSLEFSDHVNSNLLSSSVSSMASSPPISSSPLYEGIAAPITLDPISSANSYSSEIKPQTIMHSFSESTANAENFKFAYPNGPICVLEPNLYLYSEPTLDEITDFDVIINVALEIKNFSDEVKEINLNSDGKRHIIEYYYVPWTHTSRLTSDFPFLTELIDKSLKGGKKVLIHCQCGVSRSASLIMAYFMKVYRNGYNDAYGRLKRVVPQISPNLSLIYELIEWGEWLNNQSPEC